MCLFIDKEKRIIKEKRNWCGKKSYTLEAFTAEEDIEVVKMLTYYGVGNHFYSPVREEIYEFGKIKTPSRKFKTSFKIKESNEHISINEGLHSYCKDSKIEHYKWCMLFKAIIPKGSRYFIGEDDDIVSDKLIVTDEPAFPNDTFVVRMWEELGKDCFDTTELWDYAVKNAVNLIKIINEFDENELLSDILQKYPQIQPSNDAIIMFSSYVLGYNNGFYFGAEYVDKKKQVK